jgi:RNA polymerase sigma-70 factor (ECF subfamily)
MQPDYTTYSDNVLMEAIVLQHHLAFSELVNRHSSRFFGLAYRLLNNVADAEDITQDAFSKLWHNPRSYNANKNIKFTTWFYRVVTNLCTDQKRKKKPLPLLDATSENLMSTEISADEHVARTQQHERIERHIQALPTKQQIALNLCFYEELTNAEAAEVMNIKLKTLQTLVFRARNTLKQTLQLDGGNHER